MRARAPSGHEVPERHPIRLAPGDKVTVAERDTRWPAFVFVTAPSGEGWVPAVHLSNDAGEAIVLTAYDTTELTLKAGQEVTVLERDEPSGWWWCRDVSGSEGWVPIDSLEVL